jgi:hypothetical protein
MSQSESLKTDKELMWEKLSTPYQPMTTFQQQMTARGLRKGKLNVIAMSRNRGKSRLNAAYIESMIDNESD